MESGSGSRDVGRHLLGPHVVGRRVVVRRVVRGERGPSGGPALTDVLGVCTAWGGGRCVVQPETGPAVEIAVADIVSGKPVPPRPAVRQRVSPRDAQLRAMALFPGLTTERYGDWVLRRSPAHTDPRANSALAMGDPGDDDPQAALREFYGARPVVALLPESPQAELFPGWVPESGDADWLFQIAGLARVRRLLGRVPDQPAEMTMPDPGVVEVRVGSRARGTAAYDDDWLGIRGVVVDDAHRRTGLALVVLDGLLEWGAERGATTAYVQVLPDNVPALGLYERLGFTTHHGYRYLAPVRRRA